MNTIGERVLALIHESGMTQKEFSQRTGIPQSTISDWKGKRLNPGSDKLAIICDVLNVDPSLLISGSGSHKYEGEQRLLIQKGSPEYELVTLYGQLDHVFRERLIAYAHALNQIQKEDKS